MTEPGVTDLRGPSLEALQNRSHEMRRSRPPDITILRNESRVPLRPERFAKRESKIGLRNIFSKSKLGKDDKVVEETSSIRESSRHGGIRNSLVDIGNWPQKLQSSRSEISLISSPASSSRSSIAPSPASPYRSRQSSNNASKDKLRQPAAPKPRGSITAFNPPPLFQMYPQVVKHARLPTCVTPIETLVRLSESKNSTIQKDFSRSGVALQRADAPGLERKGEGEKKKKSKFAPEWTSKIYALVTSGYLLQYAAEGPFDRLPEKILQLNRDSAAYVSDLIPGRHWVVRVTSSTDANGYPSSNTKSLRSKLALRGIEKRQVSNMLLVFQSPEAMDTWLAILRREIESLGGKKKLSETGKPEVDDGAPVLKTQLSQRNLVVRDPNRFSQIISQDFSWNQENALVDPNEESDITEPRLGRMSDSTMDDGSSLVSSEGQRLDSLRDSGNRLSFVSSGHLTVVSSAESSPTHSPIRECFSSHGEDHQEKTVQSPLSSLPVVRPRPNAAAIVNRRQSMQTMIPNFDHRLDPIARPFTTQPSALPPNRESKQQSVPNFSVPHMVSRRYSTMNLSTPGPRADQLQMIDRASPVRLPRRSPPPTLGISRPLSIVLDQPSPISPSTPTNRGPALKAPDSPSMFGPWANNVPKTRLHTRAEIPRSLLSNEIMEGHQLRSNVTLPRLDPNKSYIIRPARAHSATVMDAPEPIRRAASSLEMRGRASTAPVLKQPSYKRTSLLAENTYSQSRQSFMYPKHTKLPSIEEPTSYTLAPPLTCSPKRSAPSLRPLQEEAPSNHFLAVDLEAKALSTRRSMPTLAEGPPPAPPPTCALPPIPRNRSTTHLESAKTSWSRDFIYY
ncbi:hypothetical protein F4819DRAFT_501973 [Hypoxylon fuscum]|nr:hypothetical protein F4819DRAFT_501973 [Hypoxylon fuscum]